MISKSNTEYTLKFNSIKNGSTPVDRDEVYKDIFEQAEKFKKCIKLKNNY